MFYNSMIVETQPAHCDPGLTPAARCPLELTVFGDDVDYSITTWKDMTELAPTLADNSWLKIYP